MNLSEIAGKEIVNLVTGERLGVVGEALLIPRERGFFGIKKDKSVLEVPWRSIRKIGNDMIIIEYDGIY